MRRSRSAFASAGLSLVLAASLLIGCRAFDPEPVIVNRIPDTFVTGAPAETTGSVFRRHMFWYAIDADGQVVRFIWALTDTLIEDDEDPDFDERDQLFDPADDITTTIPRDHVEVGYTTRTDSVFEFAVGLGPTLSKDVTFHMVAVDDRGGIDETPARLRFFDNTLGNPRIRFEVYTSDGPGGAEVLRWKGDVTGPAFDSPEQSLNPFIGYTQPFRVAWSASSPNGPVLGYRFKASESTQARFIPQDDPDTGEKVFGDVTAFTYQNDVPENEVTGDCATGPDCPEVKRWETGPHVLTVVAIDVAQVESEEVAGELTFQSNYPPETTVVENASFPQYRYPDDFTNFFPFSEGDTVPAGSYVIFQMSGFDRLSTTPSLGDSFCCDERLDLALPEVTFQGQIRFETVNDRATVNSFSDGFSADLPQDTLGFFVGPFKYRYLGRTQDEHGRPDISPDEFDFVAGFKPEIIRVEPGDGDSLILRNPAEGGRWPENTVEYTVGPQETLFWDGLQYVDDPAGGQAEPITPFRFSLRFEGRSDPRERTEQIESWSYALFSNNDPENLEIDGLGTDRIAVFDSPTTANLWEQTDAVEILVPTTLWLFPQLYEPGGARADRGAELARHLGEMVLQVRGKTAGQLTTFDHYPVSVRPGPDVATIGMSDKGRKTDITTVSFTARLGIDQSPADGTIDRFWPDF